MAVWEIAEMHVAHGREAEFESTFRSYLPNLSKLEGLLDLQLLRGIDREGAFGLLIEWESVEYHIEILKTEDFVAFGGALAPFLTAPTTLFHATKVIDGI